MALTLTVANAPDGADNTQRRTEISGTGVFSGSYTTGGEAITWTTLSATDGANVLLNTTNLTPLWVEFQIGTPAGTSPLWWMLQYNYATGKLQVIDTGSASGAGFAELANGAYPAQLLDAANKLYWKAQFHNE